MAEVSSRRHQRAGGAEGYRRVQLQLRYNGLHLPVLPRSSLLSQIARRCTGTQIRSALGYAMSLFGLRRELYSVFQYACQFANHFGGRVGRVRASVRRELPISWALLHVGFHCAPC